MRMAPQSGPFFIVAMLNAPRRKLSALILHPDLNLTAVVQRPVQSANLLFLWQIGRAASIRSRSQTTLPSTRLGLGMRPSATISSNLVASTPTYQAASSRDMKFATGECSWQEWTDKADQM
jgi:hypothetical protein